MAENIALGHPGAGRAAVVRAAVAAGAAAFVDALPDGYDTQLGERGLRLSSGQRQQLALARAFLRDAPLLLLDEPAAHLDAASAHDLAAALSVGQGDRTIIQVSHRRPPADGHGRVLRLEAGRLRTAVTGPPALGAGPARHRGAALAVTP